MAVGLVLGAGGVVGASWLIGALEALSAQTGLEPADVDRIVGTSAGSVIGALGAAGATPAQMAAYVGGGTLDRVAEAEDRADSLTGRVEASVYRLQRALPPIGPGSWRLALRTLRHPLRHSPATVLSGWLPRGFVSTAPVSRLIEDVVGESWPGHPSFWSVAADYRDGRRVVFGREDAPPAGIGPAVAASCAIPGFYHPVEIGGRRYVDGGVCSTSNLDLLRGLGLDLVVCLNPTSSLAHNGGRRPVDRVAAALRTASGRRLGHEARKLRAEGTEVVLLQPSAADLEIMGPNLMARARRVEVMERAVRTTTRDLRARRSEVALLRRAIRRPAAASRSRRAA
ncbi:MAG: patatin-like phospholipase family protein [Solirubrobacterales bacterium]|nr:patatin-like phospholipase family protein [Solirubrobacterales bacterium]